MQNSLLNYAFNLLAHRCYSVAEIRKKLYSRKFGPPEEIEKTINRLKELQYLDDRRYARLVIESSLRRKPQGIRLLKLNLQKRGISKFQIAEVFKEKNIDELNLAEEAMRKKLKSIASSTMQKQKEKLYRFLTSRGFNSDTILEVLNKLHEVEF